MKNWIIAVLLVLVSGLIGGFIGYNLNDKTPVPEPVAIDSNKSSVTKEGLDELTAQNACEEKFADRDDHNSVLDWDNDKSTSEMTSTTWYFDTKFNFVDEDGVVNNGTMTCAVTGAVDSTNIKEMTTFSSKS